MPVATGRTARFRIERWIRAHLNVWFTTADVAAVSNSTTSQVSYVIREMNLNGWPVYTQKEGRRFLWMVKDKHASSAKNTEEG